MMGHFTGPTQFQPSVRQIQKNSSDKTCSGQWGSHLSNLMNLTLRSIFKVIWRSELFFLMGPPTFDIGFEESRKFYVRNNILKFFMTLRRSNQGKVFKKRSEVVCLNAFILALPRNNDVDVVSFVSFGMLVYRESPCLSLL